MLKILIIGNFKNRKEVAYAKYIISKYAAFSDILVSGNKHKVFKKFDTINLSSKSSDLYINYLLSADIVFILDEKTNYHKYKTNQRIINLRGANRTRLCNSTDIIEFSCSEVKTYTTSHVKIYNYSQSFNESNIEQVIDNLNIFLPKDRLREELVFITNSPFLQAYSPNNIQRLLSKIARSYDFYNVILINLNLAENSNLIELTDNYTAVFDINNKQVLSYLKNFKGIIVANNEQVIMEYQEYLAKNHMIDLSSKKILDKSLKLYFNETNFNEYFKRIDTDQQLTADEYYQALNNQYNDDMKNKLISVIIPRYNTPLDLLFQAIDSVFASDHKHIEVIVVDDGSKNNIANDILNKYQNKNIKYFYQENQGPGIARNNGIKMASGDYIFFLDSDETINNTGLKLMLVHSELFNLDVVIGKRFILDENNNYISESFPTLSSCNYINYYNNIKNSVLNDNMPTNKLIKTNIFYDYDIWFESGFYEDDIFTALLCTKIKEYHYLNIPIVNLYKYEGESAISSSKNFDNFKHRLIAYEKTWNIINEINKEELLRFNLVAFQLYLPRLSTFNNDQQKTFFNDLKKYVIDRIDYYCEINTNYFSAILVRCLLEDDFKSFLNLSEELKLEMIPSEIIMDNYVCHTHYHIYVAIIRAFDSKKPSRLFVMKDNQKISERFLNKIVNLNIFEDVISYGYKNIISELDERIQGNTSNKTKIIESTLYNKFYPEFRNCNVNDTVFISNDSLPEYYFIEEYFNNIVKLEDAYNSFKRETELDNNFGIWGSFLKKYRGNIFPKTLGLSDKVKNIIVSKPIDSLSDEYQNKLLISDIKELGNKHVEELKDKFNHIYNVENLMNEDIVLILTQPLNANYCTTEEQVLLYKAIAVKYNSNDVLIKPHPADFINYNKYGFKTLKRDVPIEVYNSNKIKIKKAITFTSSSIQLIDFAKEKEVLFKMDNFETSDVNNAIKEIINIYQSQLPTLTFKKRLIRKIKRMLKSNK